MFEQKLIGARNWITAYQSSGAPDKLFLLSISLADYGILTLADCFLINQCVKQDENYSIYSAVISS